jgi:site-specific DNA recombinase
VNVDYFITWSTSRFARNMMELFVSQAELKTWGTRLECLNADIDDDSDSGFVNRAIYGLLDEMKSREVARDTLRSQKQAAAAGYFTGGGIPFGYRTVKDGLRSRLEIEPAEAPTIERMFALCLAGQGAQAIAMQLNAEGELHRGRRWGKNSVHYILKNELYTGVRTFNKTQRRTRTLKPRDQWIQVASHPALVSTDDFTRAQAMLEQRAPDHHGSTQRSHFLFTGLAECGICSGRLQIRNGTSRSGTLYSYYACLGHKNGAPRCLFRAVRADLCDEWLLDQVLDRLITPAVMVEALQELSVAGAQWARDRQTQRTALVAEMREIERRREHLLDLLETNGKDTPDLAAVARRLRERTDELQVLEQKLTRLEAVPGPGDAPDVDPEIAVEVMREVIHRSDAQKKRAFLGAFIERVTLGPEGAVLHYRPEALVNAGCSASVRSEIRWLPVCGPLRTISLHLGPLRLRARRSIGLPANP